jgi:hypothetical protein
VHVDDHVNDRKGLGFFVDVDVDVHVVVDVGGFYRLKNNLARWLQLQIFNPARLVLRYSAIKA